MTDSRRTRGDAEHHAELSRERAEVNAAKKYKASELAWRLDIREFDKLATDAAKELRRLEKEMSELCNDLEALQLDKEAVECERDTSYERNAQQQDRIAELESIFGVKHRGRYIAYKDSTLFRYMESLTEALEYACEIGGRVYEPLGMDAAIKIATIEPLQKRIAELEAELTRRDEPNPSSANESKGGDA